MSLQARYAGAIRTAPLDCGDRDPWTCRHEAIDALPACGRPCQAWDFERIHQQVREVGHCPCGGPK